VQSPLQGQLVGAAQLGDCDLAAGPAALGKVAPQDELVSFTACIHGVERPRLAARPTSEALQR
jgi:hypothetical protein